jgi:hypothetical protein
VHWYVGVGTGDTVEAEGEVDGDVVAVGWQPASRTAASIAAVAVADRLIVTPWGGEWPPVWQIDSSPERGTRGYPQANTSSTGIL